MSANVCAEALTCDMISLEAKGRNDKGNKLQ